MYPHYIARSISLLIVVLMLCLPVMQAGPDSFAVSILDTSNEEQAVLVVTNGGDGGTAPIYQQMTPNEAEAISLLLEELEHALATGDETRAHLLACELQDQKVLSDGSIHGLIDRYCRRVHQVATTEGTDAINLLSMVMGSGQGVFLYTLDVLATFFIALILVPIPLGFILAMFYMYVWLVASHAIPFRLVQPTTSFWLFEGDLTTIGLRGMHTLHAEENDPVNGSLLGFAGIIINLIIPLQNNNSITYYFCLGAATAVLPNILPLLTSFQLPGGLSSGHTKNL